MEERPERVIRLTEQPDGSYLVKTQDEHGLVHRWHGVDVDGDMQLEPMTPEAARELETDIEPDPFDEGMEP